MGIYISIVDDRGRVIRSNKYGVGYSTLMFTDVKRDGKKVILQATGREAIDNLNRNIKYLKDNRTNENAIDVDLIKCTLVETKNMLQPERIYTCDFSEFFVGTNTNPDYDCFNLINEWYKRMSDVIAGYHMYPKLPQNDFVELGFRIELQNALDIKYGISLEESNDSNVIYSIRVNLSEGEQEIIRKKPMWDDGDVEGSYTNEFARRKIFHAVRDQLGFTPTSILLRDKLTFYVIFDRKCIDEWAKDNPYVFCSYRLESTYDIEYLVKNTPEEKEKFYCYAAWQNAVSIRIDGNELCGLEDADISEIIGKELHRYAYEADDIIMKYIN